MVEKSGGGKRPYGSTGAITIALVIVATLIRLEFLQSLGTQAVFITFYPAVIISALYGGVWAGALATVLSAAAADYFWIEPTGSFLVARFPDGLALAIFAVNGLLVSWVADRLLQSNSRLRQAEIFRGTEDERRFAERLKHEEEFSMLAEALPQIVWITRADGWNVYFNKKWVEYTGLTLEESYGHGWNKPFHPDDRQRAWDAWQAAVNHNAPYSLECRLRRADGCYRWWLIRGVPHIGADGTIERWFGTCTDIHDVTWRRVAEEGGRASERIYHAIGDSIDYGIWVCSPDGRNTYASPSFLNLVGITQQQCSEFGWGDVLHPDERENTIAAWQECVKTQGKWDTEHRFRGVDGQWHPVLARGAPVRDDAGEITCWAGINLDISNIKKAEIALVRANRILLARSLTNLALINATDERTYLRTACQIVVDACGHTMMWIGYSDHSAEKRVLPVAAFGVDEGYLEGANITWGDDERGHGPAGTAIRSRQPNICHDTAEDARMAPWRSEALKRGFRSSIALPMIAQNDMLGVLSIYASVPNAFSEGEVKVLADIAHDIAFGVSFLRLRAANALAEQSLRDSEERYRDLANSIPALLWVADSHGVTTSHNRRWYDYTGQFPAHAAGDGWAEIVHPDDLARVIECWSQSVSTGANYSVEYRLRRATDGAFRWHLVEALLRKDPEGRPLGWFGTCIDIEDRKLAEDILRERTSELEREITERRKADTKLANAYAKLESVLESIADGFYALDAQWKFTFFNQRAEEMLRNKREDVIGKSFFDIFPMVRDSVVHSHYRHVMETRRMEIFTAFSPIMNRWVSFRVFPSSDGGFSVYFEDITEAREAAAALEVAKAEAERANYAKSAFLTSMSHELRTPLSAIIGFSQILEMDPDIKKSGRCTLSLNHIIKSGKHLLSLINDLLDLSRIEAGQITTNPVPISPAIFLSGLIATLYPLSSARSITVSVAPCDGLPNIWADETRLTQVMHNLTTNAIKYNRPGGRVDLTCERLNVDKLRLTVVDTGVGIAVERRNEVFEPFNRLGREASAIEGTGIGLALARRLLHLMNGDIDFSSGPGEGSKFWIDIPVYMPTERHDDGCGIGPQLPAEEIAGTTITRFHTVLCVDDNVTGLALVSAIIADCPGIRLLTAETAEAGITLARERRPDLILMDINLPGMDGVAALTELRRYDETRNIPVYALSAAATAPEIERGLAAGFVRYLTNPFDVHDFRNAINDACSN